MSGDDKNLINQFTESVTTFQGSFYSSNYTEFEFSTFETGLSGGDLKVAIDLPSSVINMPAQVHVSGYTYNGVFGGDVEGYSAGIIFNPFNGLDVGVEYYEDKEFFGDNWVFQAKVHTPLKGNGIAKNLGNIFSHKKTTQNPSVRSAMVSSFDRRNWILTETSAPIVTNERNVSTICSCATSVSNTLNPSFDIVLISAETGEVLNGQ